MLPPDRSPVHRVVLAARALGPVTPALRGRYSHAQWRAATSTANFEETSLKAPLIPYNPSDDGRVKWLLQWCDVLEGSRCAEKAPRTSFLSWTISSASSSPV